jgi:hypothetical protein
MTHVAVAKEDVLPYIENSQRMISGEFHPDLVINMNESGFCQRPLKASQENCVFIRTEETKPRFLEVRDANHISIVSAIALSGGHLLPLLLSTRPTLPEEIRASYLFHEFRYCHILKGYMTG